MIQTSRRHVMLGAAALATSFSTAALADDPPKVDLSDILTPPEEGEMELGPKDAKVTIVEYGSASCPHCAAFYKDVFVKLKPDYIDAGKVHFVFREFPHNDQGLAAFMLARCAPKEKYFPLLDTFFTTQAAWVPDAFNGLKNIAQQAGMSAADFEACLKNEKVAKGILDVREKGSKQYGVTGIPTFFVNGKVLDGEQTYDAMKAIIDPLLK
jgi:protein-disulfide isomerase